MVEPTPYSTAQQSHQGGRDYNEDRTAIYERDGSILLVVADGLGGHEGGDIASQSLVDAIGDSFHKASMAQLDRAESFLTLSINFAHHSIHRRAVTHGYDIDSPKTTCVVCLIHKGVATWAHSGDSRLYHIHKRHIEFVTADHVSKRLGVPHGNSPINRCVGGVENPRPEIGGPHTMSDGDILVLASDGAWHSFEPNDLIEYVDPEHPSLGINNLLQELENRNKTPSDNLSIVILFWGIKQLDVPQTSEFSEPSAIQLLDNTHPKSDRQAPTDKFDIKDLDKTINEIESFISDVDDQLEKTINNHLETKP